MSRKKRSGKKSIVISIAVILIVGGGYIRYEDNQSELYKENEAIEEEIRESERDAEKINEDMTVTFFDVGQGDCTLIQNGEEAMLIDAGNNHKGEEVVEFLEEKGVEKLDYLMLTHPDADHIGGADNVLEAVEVEKVIMPDVANDTITYEEVIEGIDEYGVEVIYPEVKEIYELGDSEFKILCPEEEMVDERDTNGASVVIKLTHGKNSFIFCGDAEEEAETAMIERFGDDMECDVLKCGHHGSSKATNEEFLNATDPTYAVISCGEDNSYGHPHTEVLSRLEDNDVQIYRTDELGTIEAVSDGKNIHWTAEK